MSSVRCSRLSSLPDAWAKGGAPTGKLNGNYRHGTRTKEASQTVRYAIGNEADARKAEKDRGPNHSKKNRPKAAPQFKPDRGSGGHQCWL